MKKTFKEVAELHLKETYGITYSIKEDDPLSCRAEFVWILDKTEPLSYLYDLDVPEILLTGIEGFESALEDPVSTIQILLYSCILFDCDGDYFSESGSAFKNLPDIIPPFSNEVFPNKDILFTVNLGDLIEETDDPEWAKDFNDNFSQWENNKKQEMVEQLWPILLELEAEHPGICVALLKSCFVSAFFSIFISRDDITGKFDVDDLWDIFGWTLDLWADWVPSSKENKDNEDENIKIIKTSSNTINKPDLIN